MSILFDASKYKNDILDILLKSHDFIKLINPHESPNKKIPQKEILLGGTFWVDGKKYEEQGYVFDHNFVDETTVEEKTFVFVETDIDSIIRNTFIDFNLYVCVFTAKSLVKITNNTIPSINDVEKMGYDVGYFGNRIDVLCDIIHRNLNKNEKIEGIGYIKPAGKNFCSLFSPNTKYYGKCLKYHISNLNDGDNEC